MGGVGKNLMGKKINDWIEKRWLGKRRDRLRLEEMIRKKKEWLGREEVQGKRRDGWR